MADGPDLLTRTRMALSDCGIDPAIVYSTTGTEVASQADPDSEGFRMAWRAVALAEAIDPDRRQVCFRCVRAGAWRGWWAAQNVIFDRCLAYLPLTEDCGVDRD